MTSTSYHGHGPSACSSIVTPNVSVKEREPMVDYVYILDGWKKTRDEWEYSVGDSFNLRVKKE